MSPRGDNWISWGQMGMEEGTVNKGGRPHRDNGRPKRSFRSVPRAARKGTLHRHRGQGWIFDSDQAFAAKGRPSIGYVAFFSDVEHEVAPVISGHRITLTYNLYFDDGGANDAVS
jgi:hypothetical protein